MWVGGDWVWGCVKVWGKLFCVVEVFRFRVGSCLDWFLLMEFDVLLFF